MTNEELTAEIAGLKARVVVLEEHDKKVDGVLTWVNDRITNNPKVTAALGVALTLLLSWASVKLGVVGPEPVVEKVPVIVDTKKDDAKTPTVAPVDPPKGSSKPG